MANLLTDDQGRPVPQIFNPTTGVFEKWQGEAGVGKVVEVNSAENLLKLVDVKNAVAALQTVTEGLESTMSDIKDTAGIKKIYDNVNVDIKTLPNVTVGGQAANLKVTLDNEEVTEVNSANLVTLLTSVETLLTNQATTLDTMVTALNTVTANQTTLINNQATMITHLANIEANTAPEPTV